MVQIQPCTQVNENEKSCRVEFVDLREEKVSLMRMKVSDYIAQKLVDEGITDAFMVTGGGAMHPFNIVITHCFNKSVRINQL